jgi:hypothetical protein
MKLPSLHQITESARLTIRRFPLAIADALVGSAAAIVLVNYTEEQPDWWWTLNNVFVASSLGIALLMAAVLVGERLQWNRRRLIGMQMAGVVLLILYGFTLPHNIYAPPYVFAIRHWLLLLGVHLLVACAPFFRKGEINGFWQFNKSIFLRLLTAALFSAVLLAGLDIALVAITHLFDIKIRPERYLQVFIVIAGIFNTWFFLSGVPRNLNELEGETAYPKGLKVFTQYVLVPLVTVYVAILYTYLVKIIVEWSWPKGWVSYLVLGFSIAGIFSLLLVHPIQEREGNVWIKRFARWYYVAEIPLVVVLLLAIWRRVSEYGITENRYFVIGMGFWLAAIVIYFLISKGPSIKSIPTTLCILAFLGCFGPWGAFSVSERSQVDRLECLLSDAGILQKGKVVRAAQGVSFDKSREIASVVRYLHNVHGLSVLQPWFDVNLDTLCASSASDRAAAYDEAKPMALMVDLLGAEYVPEWQAQKTSGRRFSAKQQRTYDVEGFDSLFRSVTVNPADLAKSSGVISAGMVRLDNLQTSVIISATAADGGKDSIALDCGSLARKLLESSKSPYDIPADVMVLNGAGERVRGRLYLSWLEVRTAGDSVKIHSLAGDLLLGWKSEPPKK